MEVREAQVRDHDELLQIIARSQLRCAQCKVASQGMHALLCCAQFYPQVRTLSDRLLLVCRCPALAQLPSRDDTQADYALAHLIRQQGPHDKVFVVQLHGVLLGCMAVTNVVDVSPLQQNFDLHVYDQLVQPEVYEAALSVQSQTVTAEPGGKFNSLSLPLHVFVQSCVLCLSVNLTCSCLLTLQPLCRMIF